MDISTSYQLLGILQHYAPNGAAQQKCGDFYGELQRDGLSGQELDRQLVNVLQDGLAHGNWPWTLPVRVPVPPPEASLAAAYEAEFRGAADD